MIRPVLEFGAAILANLNPSKMKKLEQFERRCLRSVINNAFAKNTEVYQQSGIEPISERLQHLRDKALIRYDNRICIQQQMLTSK